MSLTMKRTLCVDEITNYSSENVNQRSVKRVCGESCHLNNGKSCDLEWNVKDGPGEKCPCFEYTINDPVIIDISIDFDINKKLCIGFDSIVRMIPFFCRNKE